MNSKAVVVISSSTGRDESPGSSDSSSSSQAAFITPAGSERSELIGSTEDDAPHLDVEKGDDEESPTRDLDTNWDSSPSAEKEEEEVGFDGEDTMFNIPAIEPPVLCIMRHSTRLDVAMHEWKMKHKGSKEEGEQLDCPEHWPEWPDEQTRPYDTPICDNKLPAVQASQLLQMGFTADSKLYCSPFRRCLQTAGVLARSLGLDMIMVHRGLGECMGRVRRECNAAITNVSQHECLGEGVRLVGIMGDPPPWDEELYEATERFHAVVEEVCMKHSNEHFRNGQAGGGEEDHDLAVDVDSGGSPLKVKGGSQQQHVIVVAHGDTISAVGECMAGT